MYERELCKQIGVSRQTVWRWRREGMPFDYENVGAHRYKYNISEVREWIENNRKKEMR